MSVRDTPSNTDFWENRGWPGSCDHALMRKLLLLAVVLVCPRARADDETFRRGHAMEPRGHTDVILSLSALVGPMGGGGLAALTVPFDRVVKGAAQLHASSYLPATPDVARQAVSAAWRVAGLGENDSSLDSMASRARWSAILPEARVRVLRHTTDSSHSTTSDTSTDTPYYLYDSNSLWLEGRLTWHLDRLLFAEEEPTIERLRLERQEHRTRLAAKVVEQISKWQRARLDVAQSAEGTADRLDAVLREIEAASALDVMTAGWFSRWQREEER